MPSARLTLKYYDVQQLRAAYVEAAQRELRARRPIVEQLAQIRSFGEPYGILDVNSRSPYTRSDSARVTPPDPNRIMTL